MMARWVSTGQLPSGAVVRELVEEAHRRFAAVAEGQVATYIPALAEADPA
jgi:glutaminase